MWSGRLRDKIIPMAKVLFQIGTGFSWAGFYLVRLGERVWPRSVLSLLVWPAAVALGLADFGKQRRVLTAWSCFPAAWRPGRLPYLFRQLVGLTHSRLVYLWPDRLPDRGWLSRCRLVGDWEAARCADRPIIFASLHFGPFETLPYWLRAHGLPVTVLVGRSAERQGLKRRQYALSAPADVPVVQPVTEAGGMRQVVARARHLLVMIDVDRGKQIQAPFDHHLFRMATGAIRLAIMRDADLIPCLIVATNSWQYAIHFGAPVAWRDYLRGGPDLKEVAARLLAEFLPIMARHPSQCGPRLLSCITPAAGILRSN